MGNLHRTFLMTSSSIFCFWINLFGYAFLLMSFLALSFSLGNKALVSSKSSSQDVVSSLTVCCVSLDMLDFCWWPFVCGCISLSWNCTDSKILVMFSFYSCCCISCVCVCWSSSDMEKIIRKKIWFIHPTYVGFLRKNYTDTVGSTISTYQMYTYSKQFFHSRRKHSINSLTLNFYCHKLTWSTVLL